MFLVLFVEPEFRAGMLRSRFALRADGTYCQSSLFLNRLRVRARRKAERLLRPMCALLPSRQIRQFALVGSQLRGSLKAANGRLTRCAPKPCCRTLSI